MLKSSGIPEIDSQKLKIALYTRNWIKRYIGASLQNDQTQLFTEVDQMIMESLEAILSTEVDVQVKNTLSIVTDTLMSTINYLCGSHSDFKDKGGINMIF